MNKIFNEIATLVVFNTRDIRKHFSTDSNMFAWLRRMQVDNRIKKIKRDVYSIVDPTIGSEYADKYMIASAITKSSYVAYHSALEYHGIANQVYNCIYVAGEQRFASFDFKGVGYIYTKSPGISAGVMHIDKGCDLKVTDLERTLIDCINNLSLAGGIEEIIKALDSVSFIYENKLIEYLDCYNTSILYRKVGYLLSHYQRKLDLSNNFFNHCKKRVDENIYYFLKNENIEKKLNKTWNLVVPDFEELISLYTGIPFMEW